MIEVTEPGTYTDMSDDIYHGDPVPDWSLSASGARTLQPPNGCPAKYLYQRTHRPAPSDAFTFGHAAHKLVLGVGLDIVVIDADSWRTKAAQEAKKEALAEGKAPLLSHDHDTVQAMAAAIRAHPIASAVLNPDNGAPEQSLFWQDNLTGVWRRCRLDWLPNPSSGRVVASDYKTAASADPSTFARHAASYGYAEQARWYLDGIEAVGVADDPGFVFIVQEKEPPYLVSVIELDADALRVAEHINRRAIDVFAECKATGEWPSYESGVAYASLPVWYTRQLDDMEIML